MERIDTRKLAYQINACSDVEFAEVFAYLNKIRCGELLRIQNEKGCDEEVALEDVTIDAEYMNGEFSEQIQTLTTWIKDSLDEIVDDPETDSSAWWKQEETV